MEQHIIDNLKSLKALLDSGVLSAEEFEKEKKNILNVDDKTSTSQVTTPHQVNIFKKGEKIVGINYKYDFILLWAIIHIFTGAVCAMIATNDVLWYESVTAHYIYDLLAVVGHIGNILPVFVIKNKTYRKLCLIGVGLYTIFGVFRIIQNITSY